MGVKRKLHGAGSTDDIGLLLGRHITARRKLLALTQEQVAERVGVDPITISRFECGTHLPSLRRLASLSEALDISVAELLSAAVGTRSDQALLMEQLLGTLAPRDRSFVVESVKRLCEHLSSK